MKKITFLCFLMISFMFISCDEEEDDTDEVNNPGVEESASIVGAWEPTNLFYEGSQTLEFQGQSIEMDFSAQSVSFDNFVVNIYENNTYDSSGSYTVNMSVESMGQETTEEVTLENFFGTGTWSQDGTTFITTDDETGVSGDVTIEILNETTLKLVRTNYELDLSNAETPEGVPPLIGTSIVDYEMTLTRID
ncbi:hypothetical protein [Mesonia sp.]|uniref:hypothetical protein n=1 Tax=Mesonia sp. TaxID=1960830 RepID=UPI0017535405|nr:hypothetical protein [Mesonia sp.]HIB37274.1 hypothetical protein [Mesonia sp.]HIO26213.1 hypothetical protein [Flavobacteriaceae bacterium]